MGADERREQQRGSTKQLRKKSNETELRRRAAKQRSETEQRNRAAKQSGDQTKVAASNKTAPQSRSTEPLNRAAQWSSSTPAQQSGDQTKSSPAALCRAEPPVCSDERREQQFVVAQRGGAAEADEARRRPRRLRATCDGMGWCLFVTSGVPLAEIIAASRHKRAGPDGTVLHLDLVPTCDLLYGVHVDSVSVH